MRFECSLEEYKKYKLGELVENVVAGATPKTSVDDYWNGGDIPWLSSGEVHKKFIYFTDKFITSEGYNNSSTKIVPTNSVLIALAGQGKTRGTVAINKIELCTNQSIASIIPNEMLNYKYLFYYLESKYEYLRALSSSDGGRGGLNLKLIRSIPIQVPSIKEQENISNFINEIDKKILLLEQKHKLYDDFKKYLMQQIFTQKLRFADCTGEWNLFKLGDIVELMRNGCSENQVSFETEFPVTRIETISKGILNFDKVGYVEKIDSSYLLQYGDILLSNINSLKYIGNCVFFDEDKPLYHGMNLMLMRFKDDFNKKYLFYYMKFYQQWFQKMACQAVNQASINQSSLKKFPFYIPPTIDEQNKIVNVIDDTEHKINSIEDQIIKMEEFKKGLLQQMFVVRINWRCNFKLVKSPSFNKHLLILKNKIIFIIIK